MPDVYTIRFTPVSAAHLQEIFDYIEKQSRQNAGAMIRRIVSAIDALQQFPHRYRVLQGIDTAGVEVRSMPITPYLIRYHVDDTNMTVTVLGVRHGARRPGL